MLLVDVADVVERVVEVSWLTACHWVMILVVVSVLETAWLLTALLWPVAMLYPGLCSSALTVRAAYGIRRTFTAGM